MEVIFYEEYTSVKTFDAHCRFPLSSDWLMWIPVALLFLVQNTFVRPATVQELFPRGIWFVILNFTVKAYSSVKFKEK